MSLVFHIFQGMGVAAAIGIRPFLPALAAGALAAGDVEIDFKGTSYHFLQSAPFLLAMAALALGLVVVERRIAAARLERSPGTYAIVVVAGALGALFFGGELARSHDAAWPGWVGGIICAAVAIAATVPLLARVRTRLDQSTAGALPVYAEGAALLLGILSVVAPPVGPVALVLLLWLLLASRRRAEQKYAGLRILR